jgi:carboxyl-terminal processing protease
MFPGMIGVEVANSMSIAVDALGNISRLIIDLRGNTGGGAGALRLMSLMTPTRVPVGFSPGKRWAKRDLAVEKSRFPRLGKIPASKGALWLLGLQFLPALVTKSPIVLETEGLGSKPYDGKIVLLVDRHTASAAEMVTIFAKENDLATIVGEKTAGRLLSATSVKVGHGFRLALPTGAYFTWNGTALEGSPIEPDVIADFDWQERRSGVDAQLLKALSIAG